MTDFRSIPGFLYYDRRTEETGELLACALCWSCRRPFWFNPDRVPSIPIGADGTPELGGTLQPVCQFCIGLANGKREALGLPPIEVLPGAYQEAPNALGEEDD